MTGRTWRRTCLNGVNLSSVICLRYHLIQLNYQLKFHDAWVIRNLFFPSNFVAFFTAAGFRPQQNTKSALPQLFSGQVGAAYTCGRWARRRELARGRRAVTKTHGGSAVAPGMSVFPASSLFVEPSILHLSGGDGVDARFATSAQLRPFKITQWGLI